MCFLLYGLCHSISVYLLFLSLDEGDQGHCWLTSFRHNFQDSRKEIPQKTQFLSDCTIKTFCELLFSSLLLVTSFHGLTRKSINCQIFRLIQKQDWYKPDVYLYKDLIIALARRKQMDDVMVLWESMRKEELFPDSQSYTEVIRGFLSSGSPADAMNVYEDMKKSPDPPEELPFRILLKGLLPHPLLRNRVKQDFEELFPERHVYDPPEEIFGVRWGSHFQLSFQFPYVFHPPGFFFKHIIPLHILAVLVPTIKFALLIFLVLHTSLVTNAVYHESSFGSIIIGWLLDVNYWKQIQKFLVPKL